MTEDIVGELSELLKAVREIVRAENAHARGGESSMRDDCDMALAHLVTEFPERRLDELRIKFAAIRDTHAIVPVSGECICPKCGIRHGTIQNDGGF